jgi:HlyD family secretion protein
MISARVACALLLLAAGCRGSSEDERPVFQGVVEYDERLLAFELGGRLERINVSEGEAATAGKVVAELDAELGRALVDARVREAEAARSQADLLQAGSRREDVAGAAARVRAARASEKLLETNLARERTLAARGVTPQAVIDDLEAQLARARAERQSLEQNTAALSKGARPQEREAALARAAAADATVKLESARVERHELRAPAPGLVLDVHVETGEVVSAGAPIITLGDTQHPYVEVFVPQGELAGIRIGVAADVRVDSLPSALKGRVEHVSPKTEFTPRFLFSERERPNLVIRVRVRLDDPKQLLHAGVPAFVVFRRGAEQRPNASAAVGTLP